MSHPRHDLNPDLAHQLRFSLMASLAGVDSMTFQQARDYLGTTDSTLSKHATALEDGGYIEVRKGFVGKKPQTRYSLTRRGRDEWAKHLQVLKKIAGA